MTPTQLPADPEKEARLRDAAAKRDKALTEARAEGRAEGRKEWAGHVEGAVNAASEAVGRQLTAAQDRHLSELRHSYEVRERHVRTGARSFGGLVGLAAGIALGAGVVAYVYKDVNLVSAAAASIESRADNPPLPRISDAEQFWSDEPDTGVSRPGRVPASAP